MGASAALGAIGQGIGAAGAYQSGVEQEKEAQRQAAILEKETEMEARQLADEGKRFGARQEMDYLKSGVLLEGSPLLVLAETGRKNLEDQRRVRESGTAKAQSIRRQGRQAYISSIFQAGSMLAQGGAKAGGL